MTKLSVKTSEILKNSGGKEFDKGDNLVFLWSFSDLEKLNKEYKTDEFAPDFFIIGTNGGGEAFALKKNTEEVFMMPFIGMGNENAIFKAQSLEEFLN